MASAIYSKFCCCWSIRI